MWCWLGIGANGPAFRLSYGQADDDGRRRQPNPGAGHPPRKTGKGKKRSSEVPEYAGGCHFRSEHEFTNFEL